MLYIYLVVPFSVWIAALSAGLLSCSQTKRKLRSLRPHPYLVFLFAFTAIVTSTSESTSVTSTERIASSPTSSPAIAPRITGNNQTIAYEEDLRRRLCLVRLAPRVVFGDVALGCVVQAALVPPSVCGPTASASASASAAKTAIAAIASALTAFLFLFKRRRRRASKRVRATVHGGGAIVCVCVFGRGVTGVYTYAAMHFISLSLSRGGGHKYRIDILHVTWFAIEHTCTAGEAYLTAALL